MMMTARVAVMMTTLALSGMASWIPVAQAEESNVDAMRRQLEAVQQQLHELQSKVQRLESELGTAQAPASTPAAADVVPAAGSMPSQTPVVPDGAATTSIPPSTAAPVPAASSAVSPRSPSAPVRVEAGSTTTAIPEAFQWRETLKSEWRSIKAGMSSEEIRKLLGTPSREFTIDGKPVWYYAYPGIGNGSVIFSRDGHAVTGWQHPPYGFW